MRKESKNPREKTTSKTRIISLALYFLFFSFAFLSLPIILQMHFGFSHDKLGTYGDFFGGFNALVSLLAFGGLIYTIHLQHKDLELQREELKLTREELKRQAEAQESAAKEQANHVKLLEKQLYLETRPYIRANITYEDRVYLVIKNVGNSPCINFSMKVIRYTTKNKSLDMAFEKILQNLNCIKYSIIHSGTEHVIPLITDSDIYDSDLLSSSITIQFSFYFNGRQETFTSILYIEEMQPHLDPVARGLFAINSQLSKMNSCFHFFKR